jgi:hypothetical protein
MAQPTPTLAGSRCSRCFDHLDLDDVVAATTAVTGTSWRTAGYARLVRRTDGQKPAGFAGSWWVPAPAPAEFLLQQRPRGTISLATGMALAEKCEEPAPSWLHSWMAPRQDRLRILNMAALWSVPILYVSRITRSLRLAPLEVASVAILQGRFQALASLPEPGSQRCARNSIGSR